ncbi:hypothetical protein [Anaerovibrio lipolyticus]|uniref:hypothetical protein n=1 Tax=Anaerovibrio lipolyticus TaxID=82374 RepID=UPI0004806F3F|nr:hypothetical protein [Anaerovibrio lipolyticus]
MDKQNTKSFHMSQKEYELLQQFVEARMENNQELLYEELEGYEVPPRIQFSMVNKPAITLKTDKFHFNVACLRLFAGISQVLPIVHQGKKKIGVVPCKEEEASSVCWGKKKDDGKLVVKDIRNAELMKKVFDFMDWNEECRYKVMGEIRMSSKGLMLVFELEDALMYVSSVEEVIDEETGEIKEKKKSIQYYPDKYKKRIGLSYSDYLQAREASKFEEFSDYSDQPMDNSLFNNTAGDDA